MTLFPITLPALRVSQPLGDLFVVSIPAKLLLEVSYSEPLRVVEDAESSVGFGFTGGQREKAPKRLKEIGEFINTVEAAFPNSVIIGANYRQDGELEESKKLRWEVRKSGEGTGYELVIPSLEKLARIIDGQHRLDGFRFANPKRLQMELVCAVYLDLPLPFQAYLFATINFHQKKVDRSLAYQLFASTVEEEPAKQWSPDKLAVYLSRRLATDPESPLKGHIVVAAQNDELLLDPSGDDAWRVSTATVVEGILRLIAARPKRDRDELHKLPAGERDRGELQPDSAPLRELYRSVNDHAIYVALINYFRAARNHLWANAKPGSYIRKTVGIQALFDVMKLLLENFETDKDISEGFFGKTLKQSAGIDFADRLFQASGIGRSNIARVIRIQGKLTDVSEEDPEFRQEYHRLLMENV